MENLTFPNRLLALLPRKDHDRLITKSQEVTLTVGEILCEPGERIRYAHFPIAGIVSVMVPVDARANLHVELIGTEGMIGVPLALGATVATLQGYVQRSGTSLRLTAAALRTELAASRRLREILNRYTFVLRTQLAATVACNSFHPLEARLARWILMTLDRSHSNEIHLTHELLGKMLGVRRVGITNAAGLLQEHELVRYSRGDITVLDRVGLEKISCGCYRSAIDTYDKILVGKPAPPARRTKPSKRRSKTLR
jgi:CRP-like cAMP-binding protein